MLHSPDQGVHDLHRPIIAHKPCQNVRVSPNVTPQALVMMRVSKFQGVNHKDVPATQAKVVAESLQVAR